MKLKIFLAAVLCSLTALADETIGCTLRLADGSTIKGELITESFAGEALFAPDLALPARVVKAIAFDHKKGTCAVELTNGDRLTMAPATESFRVRSLLGEFDIPRTNIQSLSLRVLRTAGASGAEEGLVYWCTFDSEEAIVNPAVGPGGEVENVSFVPGKVGDALRVSACSVAAVIPFPAGTLREKGCIEFWAKTENPRPFFTDKGDPHFFDIDFTEGSGMGGFHLAYNANNGCGNSGLCGGCPVGLLTTHSGYSWQMPYENVLRPGTVSAWHHYALVWDANGVLANGGNTHCALLIDGKFVSKIHTPGNIDGVRAAFDRIPSFPSTLMIPVKRKDIMSHSKSAFLIDELKIWDFAKTNFDDFAAE